MISTAQTATTVQASNTCTPPPYLANIVTSAKVDYLILTGPKATQDENLDTLSTFFEGIKPTGHGVSMYSELWKSEDHPGVSFMTGHNTSDRWKIELKGDPLGYLSLNGLEALLSHLDHTDLGCTRIDCAIDLHSHQGALNGIIKQLTDDAAHQRIHPHRRHRPMSEHDGKRTTGETLYLGSTRARSCLCLYDKGLESTSGEGIPGTWLRWEARFKADKAMPVLREIMGAPSAETIASLARGIVDHITSPSQDFIELLADTSLSPPIERSSPNLNSYLRYFRQSVAPRLQAIADELGITVPDLVAHLEFKPEKPVSDDVRAHSVVREASTYFCGNMNQRDTKLD